MSYTSLKTAQFTLEEFEKELKGYSIEEYEINEFEKVLLVEDSLALYCGITEHETWEKGQTDFGVYIEELTYNTLDWKHNHARLKKTIKFPEVQYLDNMCYTKFQGYTRVYWCPEEETLCEKIGKILPKLRLRERYEAWEGVKYYLIVLEMPDVSGNMHYGVAFTVQKPHSFIVARCTESIKKGFRFGDIRMHRQDLKEAFDSWKGVKRQVRFEKYFRYFYFEKYFREKDDVWRYADELLTKAYNNEFQDVERSTYTRPANKWKSEEAVYNIVKKLYKQYKVIYQHRPFFLRNPDGGQMSYDIYISGLGVAIEY